MTILFGGEFGGKVGGAQGGGERGGGGAGGWGGGGDGGGGGAYSLVSIETALPRLDSTAALKAASSGAANAASAPLVSITACKGTSGVAATLKPALSHTTSARRARAERWANGAGQAPLQVEQGTWGNRAHGMHFHAVQSWAEQGLHGSPKLSNRLIHDCA